MLVADCKNVRENKAEVRTMLRLVPEPWLEEQTAVLGGLVQWRATQIDPSPLPRSRRSHPRRCRMLCRSSEKSRPEAGVSKGKNDGRVQGRRKQQKCEIKDCKKIIMKKTCMFLRAPKISLENENVTKFVKFCLLLGKAKHKNKQLRAVMQKWLFKVELNWIYFAMITR